MYLISRFQLILEGHFKMLMRYFGDKWRLFRKGLFLIHCALFFVVGLPFLARAANVSGTVTDTAGLPISGAVIEIQYSTEGCGTYVQTAITVSGDGTYTVSIESSGTYFLKAHLYTGNYFNEWWAGDFLASNCSEAEEVVVGTDDITGKNFKLDKSASIAGTLFSSDTGLPIVDEDIFIFIDLWTGDPCDNPVIFAGGNRKDVNVDGTYKIVQLPPGNYYLQSTDGDEIFQDEWWGDPYSRYDCERAIAISVEAEQDIINKNFQLLDKPPSPGDINMDDAINLTDAILALQVLSQDPVERVWLEGDANLDDKLGLAEVIFILNSVSGP
ncbi:MAG: hypothetical protein GY702_14230 [Desulfobulbaceae bacterium]|nr:hypothetical protein [Desulfobulbaceae bacterium]